MIITDATATVEGQMKQYYARLLSEAGLVVKDIAGIKADAAPMMVVDVNVWGSVQNETIQQPVESRHETHHNDIRGNSESYSQSCHHRLLFTGDQMRFRNGKYNRVFHQSGL